MELFLHLLIANCFSIVDFHAKTFHFYFISSEIYRLFILCIYVCIYLVLFTTNDVDLPFRLNEPPHTKITPAQKSLLCPLVTLFLLVISQEVPIASRLLMRAACRPRDLGWHWCPYTSQPTSTWTQGRPETETSPSTSPVSYAIFIQLNPYAAGGKFGQYKITQKTCEMTETVNITCKLCNIHTA